MEIGRIETGQSYVKEYSAMHVSIIHLNIVKTRHKSAHRNQLKFLTFQDPLVILTDNLPPWWAQIATSGYPHIWLIVELIKIRPGSFPHYRNANASPISAICFTGPLNHQIGRKSNNSGRILFHHFLHDSDIGTSSRLTSARWPANLDNSETGKVNKRLV